jgi:hypothetical protein
MKFLCSSCSIELTKGDLLLCEQTPIGKLYCSDCLDKKIEKIEQDLINKMVRSECSKE